MKEPTRKQREENPRDTEHTLSASDRLWHNTRCQRRRCSKRLILAWHF